MRWLPVTCDVIGRLGAAVDDAFIVVVGGGSVSSDDALVVNDVGLYLERFA